MNTQVLNSRAVRACQSVRNLTLWTLQGWVAMFFVAAGYAKVSEPMDNLVELMRWPAFVSESFVRGLGWAEIVLALAVLTPLISWRVGRLPLVTAAAGLLILETVMLVIHAASLHLGLALTNVFLLAITAPILWFRAREAR